MAILNISDEEYFKMDGINSTSLKLFIQDQIAYYNRYVAKTIPFKYSEAMTFGSALHCWVLQPELFDMRFIIKPDDVDLRTKEGKYWKLQNEHKDVLSKNDLILIKSMGSRCLDIIPKQWRDTTQFKEIALTMPHEQTWIKGKVDLLLEFDAKMINVDLKTTTDLSDLALSRTILNYGYGIQGELYRRLIEFNYKKPCESYLLFTSKDTGNARIINIDNFVNHCVSKVSQGIDDLIFSLDSGIYLSPYENITHLKLPIYLGG